MKRIRSRQTHLAGALVVLATSATFVAACGDADEVTTTGGAARAAPAVHMRPAPADALEHAAVSQITPRYGSADTLEHSGLSQVGPVFGSADTLEQLVILGD